MNTLFLLQETVTQVADTVINQAATTAVPAVVEKIKILDLVFMKQGLWIMIPLFIELALAIYVAIERYLTIKNAEKEDSNFMNNIRDFVVNGKIESAVALCKGNTTPLSRMIERGLTRIGRPLEDVSAAIENTGQQEIAKLENRLAALATVASTAPMLGFLGTVVGMIVCFHSMAANANNLDISVLANGVYVAMVTTVAGLIIGIIALLCYNYLISRISRLVNKLEAKTTEFMDLLHAPVK